MNRPAESYSLNTHLVIVLYKAMLTGGFSENSTKELTSVDRQDRFFVGCNGIKNSLVAKIM